MKRLPNEAEIFQEDDTDAWWWWGWHLEKVNGSVPCFPVCWPGTTPWVMTVRKSLKQVAIPRSYPGMGMIAEWQWLHRH